MRSSLLWVGLVVLLAAVVPTDAQVYNGRPYYGGGWGGGGWGGGTAAGNYAQGMAEMVRASGENNLSNSQAAINWEQARSMEYDNRIKGTQTYFEMRKMNKAYTDAERPKPMTSEEAFRFAKEAAPKRLSPSQLDPLTGAIAWPAGLKGDEFAAERKVLDSLFTDREVKGGGIGGDSYSEIQSASSKMLATLKANISQYAPDDYVKSKRFVESLAYEARFASN